MLTLIHYIYLVILEEYFSRVFCDLNDLLRLFVRSKNCILWPITENTKDLIRFIKGICSNMTNIKRLRWKYTMWPSFPVLNLPWLLKKCQIAGSFVILLKLSYKGKWMPLNDLWRLSKSLSLTVCQLTVLHYKITGQGPGHRLCKTLLEFVKSLHGFVR